MSYKKIGVKTKAVKICWGLINAKTGYPVIFENCPCIYETRRRAEDCLGIWDTEKIQKVRVTVEAL